MNSSSVPQRVVMLGTVFLVGLVVLFLFRAPLTASLWLDETISAWIVQGSVDDVIRRSMLYQGQSPLYYLLLLGTSILVGADELGLRSSSLLLGILGMWQVHRLATVLSGQREAGIVAAAALLCMNPFQDALLSARPYALGFVCALASVNALHRLVGRFSRLDAFVFALSCVATFYAHYLFCVIFLVHALFIVREPGLFKRMLPWIVGGVIACVPMAPQVLSLVSRRSGLIFASLPSLSAFMNGAVPVPALVAVVLSLALALVWGGKLVLDTSCRDGFRFLIPYIVTPVIAFSLCSLSGSGSMWVSRYWGWQTGMWAAFLGLCTVTVRGERARVIMLCSVFGFFALRIGTQVRVLEDWRGVAAAVQSSEKGIGLYSGLIEVESGSGTEQTEYREYVRAPLTVYGVTAPIEVISFSHMKEELARLRDRVDSFVIFNRQVDQKKTSTIFREMASQEGLTLTERPQGALISLFENAR